MLKLDQVESGGGYYGSSSPGFISATIGSTGGGSSEVEEAPRRAVTEFLKTEQKEHNRTIKINGHNMSSCHSQYRSVYSSLSHHSHYSTLNPSIR